MHSGLYSNMIWIASIGSSSGPQDFPFHIFAICFFTSSNEKHCTGPSVGGNSSSCSLGFFCIEEFINILFPSPFDFPRFCQDGSIFFSLTYVRYISTSSVSAFGKLVYYLCAFSGIPFSVQFLICFFFGHCYCSLGGFVGFLVCTVLFFALIFLVCFERLIKTYAYQWLVRPHLEYASTVWDPHTQKNIYKLDI